MIVILVAGRDSRLALRVHDGVTVEGSLVVTVERHGAAVRRAVRVGMLLCLLSYST